MTIEPKAMDRRWYNINEVAIILQESYKTIYNLLQANELGHYKVGRSYRVRESDLAAYFAKQGKFVQLIWEKGAELPVAVVLDAPTEETIPYHESESQ